MAEPDRAPQDDGRPAKNAATTGLGVFSLALGAAQLTTPRLVGQSIGVGDGEWQRLLLRIVGARELASGFGILGRRRPAGWLWSRVVGDAFDLALLAAGMRAGGAKRGRIGLTMGAVAGIAGADLVESTRLSQLPPPRFEDGAVVVTRSITVKKPRQEVYSFWRDFENFPRFMEHVESVRSGADGRSFWQVKGPAGASVEWDAELVRDVPGEELSWRSVRGRVANSGTVRFRAAPGERGTEVHVELRYEAPAGSFGATVAKLLGREPESQAWDDLRRFKQVVETGEVVRSEGAPEGGALWRQLLQRPAQPVRGEEVRA